ncbi:MULTISPECIES: two-component system sensor histidine kinase NtrB [Anaerosinus]|uniref:histidine kinase n=1 Tax=Selenobaculum gibii TaxID=3054208 RepID=A0A9Y2AF96_9FIRM|nr:ATP-binding protein [Selenobaculum gbiensis]WIW69759.1 ATP-binding protein [Selenobaculum gbiensis]
MYSTLANKSMLVQEDDYKEYFDNATTGVVYLDVNHRIKNLNNEAKRICHLDHHDIIGRKAELVFADFGDEFLNIFSVGKDEEIKCGTMKIKINGQQIYLQVNTLRIFDNTGSVVGHIIIMQDVSAVRAALKQIHTTKMLMSLGEVAAGVAHHVRTPLTTISGYLQLMLGRLENDKYTVKRDILEGLLGEVSYINNVVKELIMFAKPSVVKKPGVDINRILNEALLLTFNHFGNEEIQLQRQIIKGLPTITGDASLLQQALVNILQNALEAMGDKGVLAVKTWRDYETNMLVISIVDTGAGVPTEILPKVFEPFYTTKLDRMGLGLPIAYRIVAEHGGFINLTLATGDTTGTKVHIYLPVLEDNSRRLSVVHQQVLNLQ